MKKKYWASVFRGFVRFSPAFGQKCFRINFSKVSATASQLNTYPKLHASGIQTPLYYFLRFYKNPETLRKGGSRAAATSKMECFVIIVSSFQPLTIITKHSTLDVAAALDPPLFTNRLNSFSRKGSRIFRTFKKRGYYYHLFGLVAASFVYRFFLCVCDHFLLLRIAHVWLSVPNLYTK